MNENRPILLIEDDDVDVMTMQRVFKDLKSSIPLIIHRNVEDAINYLKITHITPSLILLDLNLPLMDGFDFLGIIKNNPVSKLIPIIVLSSSNRLEDRIKSYEMGVVGYMIKSMDYEEWVETIDVVINYWSLNLLPF